MTISVTFMQTKKRVKQQINSNKTKRLDAEQHGSRSSINFGGEPGQDIFAQKLCMKISKMPEFYMIFARKKCPNLT